MSAPGIQVKLGSEIAAIDLLIRRTREAVLAEYRFVVWETFCRILEQTPQFSGKAVAHWDILINGVGTPFRDDDIGKRLNMVDPPRRKKGGLFYKRQVANSRGSTQYIEVAKRRNEPKLKLIKRGDTVHFVNNAQGDAGPDRGTATINGPFYLQELQDEAKWSANLRKVNKPYETAVESVALSQIFGFGANNGVITFRHTRYAFGMGPLT